MTATTARKRPRRQTCKTVADDGNSSPASETFPRVATAPANLPPSSKDDASVTRTRPKLRAKTRRTSCPAMADTSELDAQISTLASIRAYGYGVVPGTPLQRGTTSSSLRKLKKRSPVDGTRRSVTATGEGRNALNRRSARGKIGARDQQKKTRTRGDSSTKNREPWMGPLDSVDGALSKLPDPCPIEREELRRTKARRLATVKGHCLLSQVGRVLRRRDFGMTAQLLVSARAEFRTAGDASGASKADEALIKIKVDIVMQAIDAARKVRDYDRLQELMFEALHYFAVLARHGQVNRHDTGCASERRDGDKKTYERLRNPRRLCREYALEDGRKSREAAALLTRKRKYDDAREQLKDARLCFDWAGDAKEELQELRSVGDELEVRENSTCGDRLTEGVASKLQFLTSKDYSKLFLELSQAATAYEVAKDQDGAKVVNLVRTALKAVLSAEKRWMQATEALKERGYLSALQLIRDTKRFISDAAKSLPFVSLSLERAGKILSPPGGLGPLDIVAEMAAIDGLKDHTKSVRALEQGMLDKAQELNTSAREVFEFTARCCSSKNRGQTGGCSGAGKTSGGGGSRTTGIQGGENRVGISRNGSSSPPCPDGRAGDGDCAGAGEGSTTSNVEVFSLSEEELNEGDALLCKIRRSTSAPTNPDDRAQKPRAKANVHPGVRHRVEDLLDEVSETEDIITRKKALERGDRLMATFHDTLKASIALEASKRPKNNLTLASAAATISAARAISGGFASLCKKSPTVKTAGTHENQDEFPGTGAKLCSETAEACLQLLADAKEAYEGQGFALQADEASRLRAGLVADRCLARALALARPMKAVAAAATRDGDEASHSVTTAADNELWLPPSVQGCSVGISRNEIQAARAAAREAQENYSRAANKAGALVARRTEVSFRGDEAMISIAPLLRKRAYEAVVEGLDHARRLYTEAGPQGLEGLHRTQDPVGVAKAAAMCDAQRLKGKAISVLRDRDVESSRNLCEQAQRCFSFVDRTGLADATADVYAAIHMVTRLASGDAVVAAAEAALGDGASGKAAQLLGEAKSFYHDAQLSYEDLVNQVTTLLEENLDDLEVRRKATELQDNINQIYDSRREGQRAVNVEFRLDCLAADASLENVGQVVNHEQFDDARTLLSAAAFVYERSADQGRLTKVKRILFLVDLVENASKALDEGRYADAEGLVAECLDVRDALDVEQPLCLRPPECVLFQGGEAGAKTAVLLRVRAAGDADRASALELLEAKQFDAAERAASSACKRLKWWAEHHPNLGTDSGSDCPAVAASEEDYHSQKRRQDVVHAAEELMSTIAAAGSKARAEGLTSKGRELKSMGEFAAAVKTLRGAGTLFQEAGLERAAAEMRAEAATTQAEALLMTSVDMHKERNFDAIAEQLERAEVLLVEAKRETAGGDDFGGGNAVVDIEEIKATEGTGDGEHPSHPLRLPEACEQGGTGEDGVAACSYLLEDLVNLRSRVAGDIIMRGVGPALDARDYDESLRLMLEAESHYTTITPGRWTTSVAAAVAIAAGKENALSSMSSSPKDLVTKRAALDGDRLRSEAAAAILKQKNPTKSRDLLSMAEACMAWAGVDPFAAGAAVVSKDIKVFESRAAGDEICKGLIAQLRDKEFERAKAMLNEALTKYRQGDAFKQIADTQAVAFCMEREPGLCAGVISMLTSRDPIAALKVLEEARPVFQVAAELTSVVLREVAELMGIKHRHITALSALCRAWVQCINCVPASSEDDDVPNPAVALNDAVSDIRKMVDFGEPILDIPFDLIQDTCHSLATPDSEWLKAKSGVVARADSRGAQKVDENGCEEHEEDVKQHGSSAIDMQPSPRGGDAGDVPIKGGTCANVEMSSDKTFDPVDSLYDGPQQHEVSILDSSRGRVSKEVNEGEETDKESSKGMEDVNAQSLNTEGEESLSISSSTTETPLTSFDDERSGDASKNDCSTSSKNDFEKSGGGSTPENVSSESTATGVHTEHVAGPLKEDDKVGIGNDSAPVPELTSKLPGEDSPGGALNSLPPSSSSSEVTSNKSTDPDPEENSGEEFHQHPSTGQPANGQVARGRLLDTSHEDLPAEVTSVAVKESTVHCVPTTSVVDVEEGQAAFEATRVDENTSRSHNEIVDDYSDYGLDRDFVDNIGEGNVAVIATDTNGCSGVPPVATGGDNESGRNDDGDNQDDIGSTALLAALPSNMENDQENERADERNIVSPLGGYDPRSCGRTDDLNPYEKSGQVDSEDENVDPPTSAKADAATVAIDEGSDYPDDIDKVDEDDCDKYSSSSVSDLYDDDDDDDDGDNKDGRSRSSGSTLSTSHGNSGGSTAGEEYSSSSVSVRYSSVGESSSETKSSHSGSRSGKGSQFTEGYSSTSVTSSQTPLGAEDASPPPGGRETVNTKSDEDEDDYSLGSSGESADSDHSGNISSNVASTQAIAQIEPSAEPPGGVSETTMPGIEMCGPVIPGEDDPYEPNLGDIDNSVNVAELKSQFSLMVRSSLSSPPGGPAVVGPNTADLENSSIGPENSVFRSSAQDREEATSSPNHAPGYGLLKENGDSMAVAEVARGDIGEVYSLVSDNGGDQEDSSPIPHATVDSIDQAATHSR